MIFMKRKVSSNDFGKQLAQLRRRRGLSQRSLGKLLGISGRMVAYYEIKTAYFPMKLLNPLCKTLNVSADELVGTKISSKEDNPKEYFLWKRFKKVGGLSVRDQKTVFSHINALCAKQTLKKNGAKES